MRIKDWGKFQHFKDRRPPWIKLYRDLLDDEEYYNLPAQSAKVLTLLWLLASEDPSRQGLLPSVQKIAFRLRLSEKSIESIISDLHHWVIQDDITPSSERHHSGPSESETKAELKTDSSVVVNSSPVWNAYAESYTNRYGVLPIRNAKVNSCLKSFMSRVPEEEAPDIASFYVRHPGAYYVSRGHPVELLLRDAEKIRTEWASNRPITQRQAQQSDGQAARGQVWQELIDEAEAKKGTA